MDTDTMKRLKETISIILLALCTAQSALSQELWVKSFESSNNIISIADQRLDFNGDACALVKVRMVSALDHVEGNVVGDIVARGTEKWVYVTAGTKELVLYPAQYLPLHVVFKNHGIPEVEGKRVYIFTLVSEALPTVAQSEETHTATTEDTKKKDTGTQTTNQRADSQSGFYDSILPDELSEDPDDAMPGHYHDFKRIVSTSMSVEKTADGKTVHVVKTTYRDKCQSCPRSKVREEFFRFDNPRAAQQYRKKVRDEQEKPVNRY